jgi:phosphatidylglycerophosphate synthase
MHGEVLREATAVAGGTRLPAPVSVYAVNDTSRTDPVLRRLERQAVASVLAAAALLLVTAFVTGRQLGLGDAYVVKTMALFAVAVLWLGLHLPEHLPHGRLGPANQVTLGRLALTALLGGLLGEAPAAVAGLAVGLAALALLLDGLDGWLARRGGWASAFGARFDMETDALLVLLTAALAWQLDKAGAWVLLSGAMRYLFVAAGALLPWLRRPLPESWRRKTVHVLQVLSLLLALSPWLARPGSEAVAAAGLLLLCYSFLVDIAWLSRQGAPPHQGVDRP